MCFRFLYSPRFTLIWSNTKLYQMWYFLLTSIYSYSMKLIAITFNPQFVILERSLCAASNNVIPLKFSRLYVRFVWYDAMIFDSCHFTVLSQQVYKTRTSASACNVLRISTSPYLCRPELQIL